MISATFPDVLSPQSVTVRYTKVNRERQADLESGSATSTERLCDLEQVTEIQLPHLLNGSSNTHRAKMRHKRATERNASGSVLGTYCCPSYNRDSKGREEWLATGYKQQRDIWVLPEINTRERRACLDRRIPYELQSHLSCLGMRQTPPKGLHCPAREGPDLPSRTGAGSPLPSAGDPRWS